MKKIIFYTSIFLALILFINIIQLLIVDFKRLTDFGFGYLAGKAILLFFFISLIFFTKEKRKMNHNS